MTRKNLQYWEKKLKYCAGKKLTDFSDKDLSVVIRIRNLIDCAKKKHDAGVSAQLLASYSSIKIRENKSIMLLWATVSVLCTFFGK